MSEVSPTVSFIILMIIMEISIVLSRIIPPAARQTSGPAAR